MKVLKQFLDSGSLGKRGTHSPHSCKHARDARQRLGVPTHHGRNNSNAIRIIETSTNDYHFFIGFHQIPSAKDFIAIFLSRLSLYRPVREWKIHIQRVPGEHVETNSQSKRCYTTLLTLADFI